MILSRHSKIYQILPVNANVVAAIPEIRPTKNSISKCQNCHKPRGPTCSKILSKSSELICFLETDIYCIYDLQLQVENRSEFKESAIL